MKTEKVKVTQVAVNAANPRLITEDKFQKLVISLLVFPKMLEYRPVVVDDKLTALGGNMRVKALQHINEMSLEEITQTFGTNKDFQAKTEAEQRQIIEFWQAWKQQPTIPIIKASTLSEAEQREFIIKDNVSFGKWDWDMLANEWETDKLIDWGMDVWIPNTSFDTGVGQAGQYGGDTAESENSHSEAADTSALPEELIGRDISPDTLPKIEGDDETAMERIIITYPRNRESEVAQLIGLPSIDKVVYNIEEILPELAEE